MAEDDKAESPGSPEPPSESYPLLVKRADGTFNIVHNRQQARIVFYDLLDRDMHATIQEGKEDPQLGALYETLEEYEDRIQDVLKIDNRKRRYEAAVGIFENWINGLEERKEKRDLPSGEQINSQLDKPKESGK